jgi:hypothetical protein
MNVFSLFENAALAWKDKPAVRYGDRRRPPLLHGVETAGRRVDVQQETGGSGSVLMLVSTAAEVRHERDAENRCDLSCRCGRL